jgi:hypothetical protein
VTYSAATVRVFPAFVSFTPLVCSALVPARRDNAIAKESDIVSKSLLLAQFILLQAGETFLHWAVVEGRSEDRWCPVALASHLRTPGASFVFRHALLVHIVLSRSFLALPEEVLLLIGIG